MSHCAAYIFIYVYGYIYIYKYIQISVYRFECLTVCQKCLVGLCCCCCCCSLCLTFHRKSNAKPKSRQQRHRGKCPSFSPFGRPINQKAPQWRGGIWPARGAYIPSLHSLVFPPLFFSFFIFFSLFCSNIFFFEWLSGNCCRYFHEKPMQT